MIPLEKISEFCWRIPKRGGMRVEGRIFANEALIEKIKLDRAAEQVANVAWLPGIQGASLAMPDIHWGYGFCIGGVCATAPSEGGVISPGGVGYDINCGVRLVKSNLSKQEVLPQLNLLIDALFDSIPTGAGRSGKYRFNHKELKRVMHEGPRYLVERKGLGTRNDIALIESQGRLKGADPDEVSERACLRGRDQCGTLGSGNHFLEVQFIESVLDDEAAKAMGIFEGQVCILIHSGSRGLGHQVCTDYLKRFRDLPQKHGITLPDRQLACAPATSSDGKSYLKAMQAAANFAWANRHLLMIQTREVFERILNRSAESLSMGLLYDVAHNIAKYENHTIEGKRKGVWVHRKGATRAFPPGHSELPELYRAVGQPLLIPGSMGTASWIMVGQPKSMELTFGTACHGAGRQMSRRSAVQDAAKRAGRDQSLASLVGDELAQVGVIARARSKRELAEEQPRAYKDVDQVVEVVAGLGVAKKVARLRTLGVIKG